MGKKGRKRWIAAPLAAVFFCGLLSGGAVRIAENTAVTAEELQRALIKGAVCCYAVEGRYPPDLEYLEKEYRIGYDREKYHVFYEAVSADLMPSITVIEAEKKQV